MKFIAAVSDTHGDLRWIKQITKTLRTDSIDFLIHSGDASSRGAFEALNQMFLQVKEDLLDTGIVKHFIFVPGNHELAFEINEAFFLHALSGIHNNIHILINKEKLIDGVSFFGSPVTPPFFDWAWNWKEKQRKILWESAPKVDVLVTHGPAFGTLDVVENIRSKENGENVGCKELKKYITKNKPKLHVFGHIHTGYGIHDADGTKSVNASIMNEHYVPVNHPVFLSL